jgi:shikimate dehydrogenase
VTLHFVLLGHPVHHSVSPAIHREAYRLLGLPHRYDLRDTPDLEAFQAALAALRRGEIAGANVTIPWKRDALRLADRATPEASRVDAANVLSRAPDGAILADNTDVVALSDELSRLSPGAKRALILGAGGAALAAVLAARRAGAEAVGVSARRWRGSVDPQRSPGAADFVRLDAELVPWPEDAERGVSGALAEFAQGSDLVIQASSAGMLGKDPGSSVADVVPWPKLKDSAAAYDLVYNPLETDFLRRARARGLASSHGLSMLVGQAAHAIRLWLGTAPPLEPLQAAALQALSGREP